MEILHSRLHLESDSSLLQIFAKTFGDITIDSWQTLSQVLNHSHLRTEAVKYACEFHADDTRSNNTKAFGQLFYIQ